MPIKTDGFLTTEEFAEALGDGTKFTTVRVYCSRGLIRGELIGRTWFIPKSEVQRFKRERKPVGRPSKAG